jgi:hypothetical protein
MTSGWEAFEQHFSWCQSFLTVPLLTGWVENCSPRKAFDHIFSSQSSLPCTIVPLLDDKVKIAVSTTWWWHQFCLFCYFIFSTNNRCTKFMHRTHNRLCQSWLHSEWFTINYSRIPMQNASCRLEQDRQCIKGVIEHECRMHQVVEIFIPNY